MNNLSNLILRGYGYRIIQQCHELGANMQEHIPIIKNMQYQDTSIHSLHFTRTFSFKFVAILK